MKHLAFLAALLILASSTHSTQAQEPANIANKQVRAGDNVRTPTHMSGMNASVGYYDEHPIYIDLRTSTPLSSKYTSSFDKKTVEGRPWTNGMTCWSDFGASMKALGLDGDRVLVLYYSKEQIGQFSMSCPQVATGFVSKKDFLTSQARYEKMVVTTGAVKKHFENADNELELVKKLLSQYADRKKQN